MMKKTFSILVLVQLVGIAAAYPSTTLSDAGLRDAGLTAWYRGAADAGSEHWIYVALGPDLIANTQDCVAGYGSADGSIAVDYYYQSDDTLHCKANEGSTQHAEPVVIEMTYTVTLDCDACTRSASLWRMTSDEGWESSGSHSFSNEPTCRATIRATCLFDVTVTAGT